MDVRLRAAQRERHLGYSEDIAWRADAFGIVLDRWYGVHRGVALPAGAREQTRLPVCVRDTAEGEVEVIRTLFNANERAAELHAGHAGRCRAHEGIEDPSAPPAPMAAPLCSPHAPSAVAEPRRGARAISPECFKLVTPSAPSFSEAGEAVLDP